MASKTGVIYIGFTGDLVKRVWEHKNDFVEGFTKRYRCHKLVYYEQGEDFDSVLEREKQVKKWRRAKKTALVNSMNPKWEDLYSKVI